MTRRRGVVALGAALSMAAVVAAGCGETKQAAPNLPFACETMKCVCTEADKPIWRSGKQVPVEWKLTGDAFCPKGYVLRLAGG